MDPAAAAPAAPVSQRPSRHPAIQFTVAGVTITLRRDRSRWDASAMRAGVPITWGRGPENPSTGRSRPYRSIGDPDPRWAAILIADRLGLDQTAVSTAFSAATQPTTGVPVGA